MPEEFDSSWEYHTDDPEIAAIVYARRAAGFDALTGEWVETEDRRGLRFGVGNPDAPVRFRLKPDRSRPREVIGPRTCRGCGRTFQPDRNSRVFCSMDCRDFPGRVRELPDVIPCELCGADFRPLYAQHRFCSRVCGNTHASRQRGSRIDRDRLVLLYSAGARMKDIAAILDVSMVTCKRALRTTDVPRRSSGGTAVTQDTTRPHLGSTVRFHTPDNPYTHRQLGEVIGIEEWGAHCATSATATGRFRAAWCEMTLVVQQDSVTAGYTGDVCPKCQGTRLRHSGACLLCDDCGETSGCG